MEGILRNHENNQNDESLYFTQCLGMNNITYHKEEMEKIKVERVCAE